MKKACILHNNGSDFLNQKLLGKPEKSNRKTGSSITSQLAKVCSKREIRITYNRSASKYTSIPFGQTKLTNPASNSGFIAVLS